MNSSDDLPKIANRFGVDGRRLFHTVLLLATTIPLLSLPVLAAFDEPFGNSLLMGLAILIGGVGHVASTASIYSDRAARKIMAPHPLRFRLVPLAAITFTAASLAWGGSVVISTNIVAAFFIVHLLWLHYHYQKQNYGLVAFAGASSGVRIPQTLVYALLMPALSGCLIMMPTLVGGALPEVQFLGPLQNTLRSAGEIIYGLGLVMLIMVIANRAEVFQRPLVALYTLTSFGFFLPALLIQHPEYAFWSYAIAHGFQYLIMVPLLITGARMQIGKVIAFLACVIAGGLFLHKLAGNHALFLCGIFLTWVHFVLDAKLWRMSEPAQRNLIRERFAYLFANTK